MSDHYILDENRQLVAVEMMDWARWFEGADDKRRVASDIVNGAKVSTVFLGLDHRYGDDGPPLVFETMIFGGEHDQWMERYSTWDEAVEGHKNAVAMCAAPTN